MWLLVNNLPGKENLYDRADIICTTISAARDILHSLDGCLSVLMIDPVMDLPAGGKKGKNKNVCTGYDLFMYALVNNLLPDTVQIVTSSKMYYVKMHNALLDSGFTKMGCNYISKAGME